MPYAMVPPGYRAIPLGQTGSIEGLGAFAPLEESSDEGALFLARLDFEEFPSAEMLAQLETAFTNSGVEHWPGYSYVVHADPSKPAVYLAWQKGFAWLPIIAGIIGFIALPPLVGTVIWWLIPEDVKNLISSLINMGMMLLVMYILMQVMKPLAAPKKPKKLPEAKT
ncbi:hypothetical protein Dform_00281 [Dehalogenimonas formicexedens]|uniref:Uncharacterized protein n=1 Tax=Dehalogenimonas formicexedens TaxID=1839801 RepID=A0A1P8F582_9CHLR|nr:hypothetical protein [Dehalogenimonas formicexedens]APV43641.1 hypothetical protein Dform_00281 [Dehalogenimonas formicexedens]